MDRSDNSIKASLSLQEITKIYNHNVVVEKINIDLAEGQFLSLLGPSGSGKTTLLRMIAGLVKPDGGKIILQGQDISSIPANKRNFGMVFQQYALFPHMTVWENVAYGLKARSLKAPLIKEKVAKYLDLVELSHLASRKPKELSGGQQQRVSLARALAVEPLVLLFDEPLSNLDARLKEQMLSEIRDLHRTLGFTAVYVTHDQNEALYLSDKIAVLNKGKIEQQATPEQIVTTPATPFVADFFGYTNRLEGAVFLNEEKVSVGNIEIPVGHLGSECKPGDQGTVLLRPTAIRILDSSDNAQEGSEATVLDSRYLGGSTECRLKLGDSSETELTAVLPRLIQPLPQGGMKVRIGFQRDSVTFFKEG